MYTSETLKSELPYHQEILCHYKVSPCQTHNKPNRDLLPNIRNNDQSFCFLYHSQAERRRKVLDDSTSALLYQPVLCTFIQKSSMCIDGDECKSAHNQAELDYHPLLYKTEPCVGCQYDANAKFCPYYHSDENSRRAILERSKSKLSKENSRNHQNVPENAENASSLDTFKSRPCPLKGSHNPKICEYYHHDKDHRRPTNIFSYSSNMCAYVERNEECPNGDKCQFCHNKVEQLYHPLRYKRKFCTEHPQNIQKCDYGDYCSFAHSEEEIQIELLHNMKKDDDFYLYKYKTVFCPYIYSHDRNQCVYAHNPQDLRRDPSQVDYNPVQCVNWSRKQIFSYEDGGCPDRMQCKSCHGWKELEYHPMYYKTEPCRNVKKCMKKDCPFYHSNSEQRTRANMIRKSQPNVAKGPNFPQNIMFSGKENPYMLGSTQVSQSNYVKKKGSNNSGPILAFGDIIGMSQMYEAKGKRSTEASTRPNSNISIKLLPTEDSSHQEKRMKKSKKISLQNKSEKILSPISTRLDKPKGLSMGNGRVKEENTWKLFQKDDVRIFDDFKSFGRQDSVNEKELNDSIDSLHSYTAEDNVAANYRPTEAVNLKGLYGELEKKGFGYAVNHFKYHNADVEILKNLSVEDFYLFHQIPHSDRAKIVGIIQDTLDGEALFAEVNTIQEGSNQTYFNGCSFLQGNMY